MSWPIVKLGDVFDIARGGSPRPIQDYLSDAPDAVNWISIRDASASGKYIEKTALKIRKEGVARSRMVHPGDFVLTNSMSFGHPYIMHTSGCIHDGWLVLSDRGGLIDQDFFYHLLGSELIYQQFERLAAGAVVKNLNIGLVQGVEVPLPPLSEQRRIANILDKADAIRRKRHETIALADELVRSAFLEMFGDPVSNPKGWPRQTLADLIQLSSGRFLPAKAMEVGPYPVFGGNGVNGTHSGYMFEEPKIVIGRVGVYCGVVHRTPANAWVTDNALYVAERSPDLLDDYLEWFLRLMNLNQYADRSAQPLLSGNRIYPLKISIPPIGRQAALSSYLKDYTRLRSNLGESAREAILLSQALVARAFSGEL